MVRDELLDGFDPDGSGANAGARLKKGVYCATSLKKAMGYAEKNPAKGIIFELCVDLGMGAGEFWGPADEPCGAC